MTPERVTKDLLDVLPYWNHKLVRPFKQTLRGKMSLDTYYCLQTVHFCGPLSVTELAQLVKAPKQQVSKLVENLCSNGLLARAEDLKDRRAVRLAVTDEAVAYIQESYYQNREFMAGLEHRLTPEEIEKLDEALETLLRLLPKLE